MQFEIAKRSFKRMMMRFHDLSPNRWWREQCVQAYDLWRHGEDFNDRNFTLFVCKGLSGPERPGRNKEFQTSLVHRNRDIPIVPATANWSSLGDLEVLEFSTVVLQVVLDVKGSSTSKANHPVKVRRLLAYDVARYLSRMRLAASR